MHGIILLGREFKKKKKKLNFGEQNIRQETDKAVFQMAQLFQARVARRIVLPSTVNRGVRESGFF